MWPFVRLGMLRKGTTPDIAPTLECHSEGFEEDDWAQEAELVALSGTKQNEGEELLSGGD